MKDEVLLRDMKVSAYKIPTDFPESDGTLTWTHTTLVLVQLSGGGREGLGYTYADAAVAQLIDKTLRGIIEGADLLQIPALWNAMTKAIRNDGNCGLAAMAVSAVDSTLWDLKAKLLDKPLAVLLGMVRSGISVYGSGGFTSYPADRLQKQLSGWVAEGISRVKMKVGREPAQDLMRVRAARKAIGEAALFADANGAYSPRQAAGFAKQFAEEGVSWFEEPVSSDDLEGMRFVRQHAPAAMNIAAGEYGYHLPDFRKILQAGAVDILQADATRCGGISGFLKAGHLCEAYGLPFSSHCAPALHLQAALSLPSFYLAEYFYDHVRIEKIFFDGVATPEKGMLHADLSRPGLGLELKEADVKKYLL